MNIDSLNANCGPRFFRGPHLSQCWFVSMLHFIVYAVLGLKWGARGMPFDIQSCCSCCFSSGGCGGVERLIHSSMGAICDKRVECVLVFAGKTVRRAPAGLKTPATSSENPLSHEVRVLYSAKGLGLSCLANSSLCTQGLSGLRLSVLL